MKRMIFFAVVILAVVASTVCYNHENEMSDLVKANVRALASSDVVITCEGDMGICVIVKDVPVFGKITDVKQN